MKIIKQIALNKLFNLCMALGAFMGFCSISFFAENQATDGWVFAAITLLLTVIPAIFTPYCYTFDSEGVSLCYLFLPVERYLWKDVYAIEVEDTSTSSKSVIFEFFYAHVFAIMGQNVGKSRFYMNGHIRKSFRTKKLLEKYWDGTITGYLFEDTKTRIKNHKTKKQLQIKSHLTDEIVPMERYARAESREWLSSFTEKARQENLDIKTKYIYVTDGHKELLSRPREGYTYTLLLEIAYLNERDTKRMVDVSVDLLYVRLGKTSYRGVKNKNAKEELVFMVSDTLNEIIKNGIESYCKDH